jgi:hypothetical protein
MRSQFRLTGLKALLPEVEATVRAVAAIFMLTLVVLPMAWGYQQRAEARQWREMACSYRLRQALTDARLLTASDERGNPCTRLDDLGLRLSHKID